MPGTLILRMLLFLGILSCTVLFASVDTPVLSQPPSGADSQVITTEKPADPFDVSDVPTRKAPRGNSLLVIVLLGLGVIVVFYVINRLRQ